MHFLGVIRSILGSLVLEEVSWSDRCMIFCLWAQFGNAVSELRAQVEMMVLSADGVDGVRTCVLRPSNLFGPGD